MRAFAILMMLQGHFVDSLLDATYKDTEEPLFNFWAFFRGITPALFFTVSGLVFVYLLLRKKEPFWKNERVRKGIKRAFHLIFWGYLLRFAIYSGKISKSFWKIDVLHCIGISLLAVLAVYGLFSRFKTIAWYGWTLLTVGVLIFLFYPSYDGQDYSFLPFWLENYFTKENGSVFRPLPWVGYAMIGGFIGTVIHSKPQWCRGYVFPTFFIVFGLLVHQFSSDWLRMAYQYTGWQNFISVAGNNFTFIRLGHVFVLLGLFIFLERWHVLGKEGNTFLRIGQETLLIYKWHYVLLYGSFTGVGLYRFLHGSLNPWQVAGGAVLFVVFFILMIHYQYIWQAYYEGVRDYIIAKIPQVKRTVQLLVIKAKRKYGRAS